MNVRARCACWLTVLATACSDGTAPTIPPAGLFTAGLIGARSLQLAGSASAGTIFIETGAQYAVRMFDTGGDQVRGVSIVCQGEAVPEVGVHPLGLEEECSGRYFLLVQSSGTGLATNELAESATGSFTVTTKTDQELAGRFMFSGDLVVGTDSVGSLTVTGTFRAVPLP